MSRLREEWKVFLLAVQFLTRVPVNPDWSEARMAATPRWYPAVGLLVGAVGATVFWAASWIFPTVMALILSTGATVLLTGAFHEDGFADFCDGLGGAVTRERALEIMRDSRLGTYGAVGLGLLLAAKIAALATVPGPMVLWALIAGHAASRASAVLVIATSDYVRDHGTGKPVATGRDGLGPAWLVALLALLPLGGSAVGAVAGLALGHLAVRRVFERRLGGYTGDCLGAVQQASEVGLYLGIAAWVAVAG